MTSRAGKARGLTLVETLASVVILSVGTVYIMQALLRAAHAQAVASQQADASLLALSKLADVELAVREGRTPEEQKAGRVRLGPNTFDWELTTTPAITDPKLLTVALAVTWEEGGVSRARRVDTLLRLPEPEHEK